MHYHIVKEVSDIDGARLVFYGDEGSPDVANYEPHLIIRVEWQLIY
jgi:hypothetical protein